MMGDVQAATPSSRFESDGFLLIEQLLSRAECEALAAKAASSASGVVGSRGLLRQAWCQSLASQIRRHPPVSAIVPADFVAVQCTYFEKSSTRNWLVPAHQDLGIPVAGRIEHPQLQGWSEKEGLVFVQAPAALLQDLVAVRLHLEVCGVDDGPLRVIPGSHRAGVMTAEAAAAARKAATELVCVAEPGSAWAMRPLLLHASSRSKGTSLRRVLHFLFGPPALPCGLAWHDMAGESSSSCGSNEVFTSSPHSPATKNGACG